MLTREYLKSILLYKSGFLFHKKRPVLNPYDKQFNNRWAGKSVGSMHHTGYMVHTINKKQYNLHRLIYLYHHGFMPDCIDHIDQNKTNNTIENLQESNPTHNGMNRSLGKNNSSGFIGVVWDKRRDRWKAQIKIKGKQISIGTFKKKSDAVRARLDREASEGFSINHGNIKS